MKDSLQKLKELPLKEGIKLICSTVGGDDFLLLKKRFLNLEYDFGRGIITYEDFSLERNRIQYGLVNLIDNLNEFQVQQITEQSFLKLDPKNLFAKFSAASHRLYDWKSHFQNVSDSHIQRTETDQLIEWIDAPLAKEQKGIALLAGDAGTGKSVVLRDVLLELQARKMPVLGIKADQYCVESTEKLEEILHLKDGIERMVWALVQENERVVVLIDQIDALSQSLSSKRIYLENFTNLVQTLAEIPNVRIVVSCRKYDLQNDHEFAFYRRQKAFTLGLLNSEEVLSVLKKLSNELPKLPDDLIGLLKTPLHLEVFCRIFRPDLAFERITVLRDLYDELWLQKIIEIKILEERAIVSEKIEQLVFELAQKMYDNQDLVANPKAFRARFSKELEYLKSEGIILETKEGLTFFHQTFYDFSFAKHFVKSGVAVEQYLRENLQNLHIRACLKMMLEFLREGDNRVEYLRVLREILSGSEFYFHIKSLTLSLLGYVKKPFAEEMQIARELIFSNFDFFKAFLASVKSRAWILFLIEENQPQRLIEAAPFGTEASPESKERWLEILNGLLVRHLPESRHEILRFVADLPEIEGKVWLVQNTLRNINVWDNPLTFKLFNIYAHRIRDVFFSDFLKTAVESDLNWSFKHLKKAIQDILDTQKSYFEDIHIGHDFAELIEHLIEKHPEPTFDLLLDFQVQFMLASYKHNRLIEAKIIFNDFPYYRTDLEDNSRDDDHLFPLLLKCTRVLAGAGYSRFSRFASENIESLSGTWLLILVEGFRANILANITEIPRFLSFFIEKKGVDAFDALANRVRRLLAEAFLEFSEMQKRQMILIISQIESDHEREWANINKQPDWIGEVRLKWLKCLPENEIAKIPEVAEIYRQLLERFPDLEDKDLNKMVKVSRHGPPIEQQGYSKMKLEDWKESFAIINEKHEYDRASGKGGSLEYAGHFAEEVKKRPDYFFPLIEDLISNLDLPRTYLIHALDGLKEAKYAPERLLFLFKKLLPTLSEFDVFEVRRLIWLCSVFSNEKIEDDFVLEFLVKMAATHADPLDDSLKVTIQNQENESIHSSGFNSIRGNSVRLLTYFYYFKKHENLIFETLERIAEHDFLMVRSQMMPRLALLSNLDRARSLRLFLRLVQDNEPVIMEHSAWSAQYFTRQNFDGMRPYFENALTHPKLAKDMGIILSLTYVFEHRDALNFLNRFFEISDEAKAGAIEAAAHNIRDENGNLMTLSVELFERFLEETSDAVIHAYDIAFKYLKLEDFVHLQPTLKRFSRTVAARKNPGPFYEYLIACAKTQPEACLDLVENFAEYEKPSVQNTGYYDNEPLKVVLNVYQSLWGKTIKDSTLLDKSLRLFDAMLLNDRFRRDADKVLSKIER